MTVTTAVAHGFTTGDQVNILSTTNFNAENVTITVTGATTFTYSATGSATPETAGTVQDGNIVTPDGNDVTLDGTVAVNGVPVATLIFDPTVLGFGAWRIVSVSITGGGSGINFPIDFPEEADRGTVTTTQTINFANSTRHSVAMTIGAASVAIDISNEPPNELALASITVQQDGTGGRAITFVDTIANSQTIIDAFAALSPNGSISFMIEWERAVFTAYLKTGNIVSGGGGLNTNLSNMTATTVPPVALSMNSQDIVLVDRFQMSGGTTSATAAADHVWYISTGSPGDLISNVPAAANWGWSSSNVTKMILTDTTLEKRNVTAPTFQLYNTIAAQTGTAGTMAFNANSTLTSTGVAMAFLIGDTENIASDGSGSLKLGVRVAGVPTNFLTINDSEDDSIALLKTLTFSDLAVNPTANGEMNRNGADMFVFSGGALRNMSNIGVAAGGADVFLSNLTSPTSINQDLIPQTGLTLGTNGDPWEEVYAEEVTMPVGGTLVSTRNMIISDSGGMRFTTPTGNEFDWGFAAGAAVWAMSSTVFSGPSVILSNSLLINNSSADPLANGQFTLNGTAVKVMTGGVVKNLNDIGTGSFLPLAGGTMTGAINMGDNDITAVDDIIFDQANTSIETASDIVTHDFPSGGTWRVRELSTSRVIIDSAFRITSSTNIGVFGSTAVAKQTVTGSRGGNAALASLLTALANFGWITDSTTA